MLNIGIFYIFITLRIEYIFKSICSFFLGIKVVTLDYLSASKNYFLIYKYFYLGKFRVYN